MCGIAGQIRFDGTPVERGLLEDMCAAVRHRGPDSRGLHLKDGVGLGIQRLRVIDLATGDQPIYNEDGSVVVVLNGEIYNYRELREDLSKAGHRFTTDGDTEVIVHLYEDRGPACVHALRGMFAFALWDGTRRRVLLARDRVGKKPLYYSHREGTLSFASELFALLRDPDIPREVDYAALDAYLAYRWVPSPRSAFAAVRKLPPASTLLYSDGQVDVERYWRLDFAAKRTVKDVREVHEQLRDHLREAVRRRMISDVPLGAFLSGGVDSSAIVALMAELSSAPVKTFSIGFANERYNELPQARLIAERFSTDHHEHVVEPEAMAIIPKIVRHYGEPFGDASAVPSFYVAEMTGRDVTVALNGDGGDEAFAGYTHYVSNVALHRLEHIPKALRVALAGAGALAPSDGRVDSWRMRINRLTSTLAMDPRERYIAYVTNLKGLDREALYTPLMRELIGESSLVDEVIGIPWEHSSATVPIDRMLDVDTQTWLPDDLLTKIDIASMAYSLEARSPFLDQDLMEYAAGLPGSLKLKGTSKKIALRGALRGVVPDQILDAPKRGFRPPVYEWLRTSLRDYSRELLLDGPAAARGHFERGYVERLLDEHQAGERDHAQGIWTLLMYELWHREIVEAAPASRSRDPVSSGLTRSGPSSQSGPS
jgi:asparagine synthase (glutamine-hydrolysing)